ncbi:MAG: aldehyde dehydrogenase family protein [Nitrososphaeria archaeon]
MQKNIPRAGNPPEDKRDIINPSTMEVIGSVPMLTLEQVREKIDKAHETYQTYSKLPSSTRRIYLKKAAELIEKDIERLSLLMSAEIGRPIKSARVEIKRAGLILESCASEIERINKGSFVPLDIYEYPEGNEKRFAITVREPLGVVATITPFNFPAVSFAHKVGAALAVGNTVVHKPTISAPLTQIEMANIMLKSGFPEGSINILTGDSRMIGKELVENSKIKLISFTGSSNVGLEIASKAVLRGVRVIMELGGSDAEIILDDADLDKAVSSAIFGRYDYAGQFCNSTKRLFVNSKVADKVVSMLIEKIRKLNVGNASEETTDIGPLINEEAVNRMREFVRDSVDKGGKILYQGSVPERGTFFPPTLIQTVTDETAILRDEVFGPILPIRIFDSDDEVVNLVNSSRYGLNASVFSRDFSRAYKLSRRLEVGTVVINDTTRLRWDNLPFGGTKLSGIGRESVHDTMLEMTEPKVISYTLDGK